VRVRREQAHLAMKRHKHLFDQVASLENLLAASRAALREKKMKPAAARYLAVMEKEVFGLHEELHTGNYRHGPYHYFTIHEPKARLVAAARFRDRVLHHALVRVLEPLFEPRFIEDSFACRPGKGTHAGMRRAAEFARRFPYALKCDVRKYFPSIHQATLSGQVKRVIGDSRVIGIVDEVLRSHADTVQRVWPTDGELFDVQMERFGLPIGNLTSQFLANVYLNELDHFVKHELRVKGYLRYVDDFILFGPDRATLRSQGRAVGEKLAELRLTIHPDKYRLGPTSCGVDFTGFIVFADGRIRLRSENVRRFAKRFSQMRHDAKGGRITWPEVTQRVRSWIAHAAHAHSHRLRADILGA
jgi:RNA-directed DNA polymerase